MSKLKYILLLLAIALIPQIISAKKVKIGDLYYELNEQNFTAAVTYQKIKNNYKGLKEISIPNNINYKSIKYTVTSIGLLAFSDCSRLKNIIIPNSVTSIGYSAFSRCSGLTSVTIPNSVTSIDSYAFSGCTRLKNIIIPNSVTSIGEMAFRDCSGLTSVTIPNSVKTIGKFAFEDCSGLTSVTISNSVSSIGEWAFRGCSGLTSVTIPNSVTSIEKGAFSRCSGLTSVMIPNSVYSIGAQAFSDCSGLTSVTIPNSVTSIGEWAFSSCSGLTSVTIPYSVTSIEKGAFSRCRGLTSITIPNSVTSIGDYAFEDCSGLTSVTIPNSVTSIEKGAFRDCSGLTSVTIPNSVYSIGAQAFSDCSGLTSVTIPNSVTSIGEQAFSGCSGLTNITISNSVISIGSWAFSRCRGLTSVTIPNSVTSIGEHAFLRCSGLTSVTIPNSVTSIGWGAFYDCGSLKQIIAPQNLVSKLKNEYNRIDIVADETYYASKDADNKNQPTDNKLNVNILSWEEFYRRNRKAKLTYEDVSQIEAHINREIEKWQVKDEFESTNEWRARVNETTRQQKVKELSAHLIEQHNREEAQINEDQKRLAQEYEKYRQDLIDGYYRNLTAQATKDFSAGDFSLNPYDADHGTFLIRSARYGDILLPIAARDEARSFKENWETIKRNIRPEFVPNGEEVALTKLIFTNNGKEYVYDSHTEANYAVTDVKYNFKPVELADISLADINTNLPALTNSDVSSQLISISASEAITPQWVEPSNNTVVASDRSDVDYAIPTGSIDDRSNTFAVIIANEDYSSNARVPYAANDGEIMARYLTSAVGLPENHVRVYKNATYGKVAEAVNYIEKLAEAYGEKMNLIFYYAGHGVPDEKTKTALLLPVDGNPSISKTCYSVEELVKNLGNLKANNVILMIDACFSGATRYDDLLVAASGNRGVRLRTNDISPIGNMVVLTATQGDETAYPYDREQHGLFTYFLLRKLQENRGKVTLGELADYVIENVKQTSIVNNGKLQTPTVTVSPSLVGSWRDIPLK